MNYTFSHYKIYDEHGQLMRWVKSKEEATAIIETYKGWSFSYVLVKKQPPDLSAFEPAPF
jgi:hypothetical protein